MLHGKRLLAAFFLVQAAGLGLVAAPTYGQMKLDLPADTVRKAANKTHLDDLAVHDTALIYRDFCLDNGSLFVPGWASPLDLANSTYQQNGIILRVEVLPGRKLKGTLVDGAQAQQIAKGQPSAAK